MDVPYKQILVTEVNTVTPRISTSANIGLQCLERETIKSQIILCLRIKCCRFCEHLFLKIEK